ncbi:MAG: bifunctional phosphoribosyl-AMP cyclohydrolase/phosphoribosyl-ATP diphosphatase [Chloroflexi bacterium]|nr:MAG: bifunctional phosphoribosyl-AMP cyclohydrolase/phosphoribosyl-ATP diphosphatase [Chloroflexota bacterium]
MSEQNIAIEAALERITWDANGLAAGVVVDARSGETRMLGYLNRESLRLTLETGYVHFYSRSRQRLWKKGESSGHVLELVEAIPDCDGDTLLLRVVPHGPTCHTGAETCFFAEPLPPARSAVGGGAQVLARVAATIEQRYAERPDGSYTTYLFNEGIDKIGKKIGEEAAEVIIAAKNGEAEPLAGEAADLLYHLLVLLRASNVPLEQVWQVLEARHGRPPRKTYANVEPAQ